MELTAYSATSSQWENQRKGLQNILDSPIKLGMEKDNEYVRGILSQIWEHQKGAPRKVDSVEILRTLTKEVILLLSNNDNKLLFTIISSARQIIIIIFWSLTNWILPSRSRR